MQGAGHTSVLLVVGDRVNLFSIEVVEGVEVVGGIDPVEGSEFVECLEAFGVMVARKSTLSDFEAL